MHTTISRYFREPVNALTHFLGILLSIVALILLIRRSMEHGSLTMMAAFIIFGVSMILLYTSSTLYHSVQGSQARIKKFRTFDHMMIYALIAGTFTPFCLLIVGGRLGILLIAIMWAMAITGIIFKLFKGGAVGWISITIYVIMGWAGMSIFPFMLSSMPVNGLIWIGIGAVVYTVGAIIYGAGRPDPLPEKFGYHEIWHLFVLGGTFSHFWAIYRYVAFV